MGSTVNEERIKLNEQYVELRVKIIKYYKLLPLVGREVGAKAHRLPPKLGHWSESHSALVRAACPEMESAVQAIERLRGARSAELIKAAHVRRKPGGRRKADAPDREQLNPGEWPPKYK